MLWSSATGGMELVFHVVAEEGAQGVFGVLPGGWSGSGVPRPAAAVPLRTWVAKGVNGEQQELVYEVAEGVVIGVDRQEIGDARAARAGALGAGFERSAPPRPGCGADGAANR